MISLCREECASTSVLFGNIQLSLHIEHVHPVLGLASFFLFQGKPFAELAAELLALGCTLVILFDIFFPRSFAVWPAFMSCALLCIYVLYGYSILRLL